MSTWHVAQQSVGWGDDMTSLQCHIKPHSLKVVVMFSNHDLLLVYHFHLC